MRMHAVTPCIRIYTNIHDFALPLSHCTHSLLPFPPTHPLPRQTRPLFLPLTPRHYTPPSPPPPSLLHPPPPSSHACTIYNIIVIYLPASDSRNDEEKREADHSKSHQQTHFEKVIGYRRLLWSVDGGPRVLAERVSHLRASVLTQTLEKYKMTRIKD